MKRWKTVTRDVNGAIVREQAYFFRWTAESEKRELDRIAIPAGHPDLDAIFAKHGPMFTTTVERT